METRDQIKQIEEQIQKLQNDLQFAKSKLFLEELEQTAIVRLPIFLREYYDNQTEIRLFDDYEITGSFGYMYFQTPSSLKRVKMAIDSYKSKTEKNPEWFSKAKWHAKFCDNYLTEQKQNQ